MCVFRATVKCGHRSSRDTCPPTDQERPDICELLIQHRASISKVNLIVLYSNQDADKLGLYSTTPSIVSLRDLPTNLRRLDSEQQVREV